MRTGGFFSERDPNRRLRCGRFLAWRMLCRICVVDNLPCHMRILSLRSQPEDNQYSLLPLPWRRSLIQFLFPGGFVDLDFTRVTMLVGRLNHVVLFLKQAVLRHES